MPAAAHLTEAAVPQDLLALLCSPLNDGHQQELRHARDELLHAIYGMLQSIQQHSSSHSATDGPITREEGAPRGQPAVAPDTSTAQPQGPASAGAPAPASEEALQTNHQPDGQSLQSRSQQVSCSSQCIATPVEPSPVPTTHKAPLQGAWASRSQGALLPVSGPKQQALAKRMQGVLSPSSTPVTPQAHVKQPQPSPQTTTPGLPSSTGRPVQGAWSKPISAALRGSAAGTPATPASTCSVPNSCGAAHPPPAQVPHSSGIKILRVNGSLPSACPQNTASPRAAAPGSVIQGAAALLATPCSAPLPKGQPEHDTGTGAGTAGQAPAQPPSTGNNAAGKAAWHNVLEGLGSKGRAAGPDDTKQAVSTGARHIKRVAPTALSKVQPQDTLTPASISKQQQACGCSAATAVTAAAGPASTGRQEALDSTQPRPSTGAGSALHRLSAASPSPLPTRNLERELDCEVECGPVTDGSQQHLAPPAQLHSAAHQGQQPGCSSTPCNASLQQPHRAGASTDTQPAQTQAAGTDRSRDVQSAQVEWTVVHTQLVQVHTSLLMHGVFHDCLVEDLAALLAFMAALPSATHTAAAATAKAAAASNVLKRTDHQPLESGSSDPEAALEERSAALLPALLALVKQQAWPVGLAVRYVGAVLECSARLVGSLGSRLCSLVLHCPGLSASCPALLAHLREQQEQHKHRQQQSGGNITTILTLNGGPLRLSSSSSGTSGLPSHPGNQEVARRQANQERCRDMFLGLAREAAGLVGALGEGHVREAVMQELQAASWGRPASSASAGRGSPAGLHVHNLLLLQRRCRDMLGGLHPDSITFLADLFTSCVLQAAVTGEAVMVAAVASLAQQDPSRFARLSARLQADTPPVSAACRAPRMTTRPPTAASSPLVHQAGSTPGSSSRQPGAHEVNRGFAGGSWEQAGDVQGVQGSSSSKDFVYASAERLARSIQLLDDFAPVQRGYALMCDLCDSQSFTNALGRCMADRLSASLAGLPVWGKARSSTAAPVCDEDTESAIGMLSSQQQRLLTEQLVVINTLANYLSYLTHSQQPNMRSSALTHTQPLTQLSPSPTPTCSSLCVPGAGVLLGWPGPTRAAQHLIGHAVACHVLPLLMPCVANLLWHVHLDPAVLVSQAGGAGSAGVVEVRAALSTMCALQAHPDLQPGSVGFSTAAQVVRSLVDEVLSRLAGAAGCGNHQLSQMLTGQPTSHQPHTPGLNSTAGAHHVTVSTLGSESAPAGDMVGSSGAVQVVGSRAAASGGEGVGSLRLGRWDVVADTCLVELCCPGVSTCCRVLAARRRVKSTAAAAGGGGGGGGVSVRSISVRLHSGSPGGADTPHLTCTSPVSRPPAADEPGAGQGGDGSAAGRAGDDAASEQGKTPADSLQGSPTGGKQQSRGPRKVAAVRIHTRFTRSSLAFMTPAALLPPGLAALLQPDHASSPPQALLQQAFMHQYSGDDQPVKLKEVCGSVTELVAVNATSLALSKLLPGALACAFKQLQSAAATAAAAVLGSEQLQLHASTGAVGMGAHQPTGAVQGGGGLACSTPASCRKQAIPSEYGTPGSAILLATPPASTHQQPPTPGTGMIFTQAELDACQAQLAVCIDGVAVQVVKQVLMEAEPLCTAYITQSVTNALAGLLPASWPAAVITCAGVMSQRLALTNTTQRLVQQVPPTVLQHLQQHMEPVAKAALKQLKTQGRAVISSSNPDAPPPPGMSGLFDQPSLDGCAGQQEAGVVAVAGAVSCDRGLAPVSRGVDAAEGDAACVVITSPLTSAGHGEGSGTKPRKCSDEQQVVEMIQGSDSNDCSADMIDIVQCVLDWCCEGRAGDAGRLSVQVQHQGDVGNQGSSVRDCGVVLQRLEQLVNRLMAVQAGTGSCSAPSQQEAEGLMMSLSKQVAAGVLQAKAGRHLSALLHPLCDLTAAAVQAVQARDAGLLSRGCEASSSGLLMGRALPQSASQAGDTGAAGGGVAGVAHVLGHVVIQLFTQEAHLCREAAFGWRVGPDDSEQSVDVSRRGAHTHAERIGVLTQLPVRLIGLASDLQSAELMRQLRVALQHITIPGGAGIR